MKVHHSERKAKARQRKLLITISETKRFFLYSVGRRVQKNDQLVRSTTWKR